MSYPPYTEHCPECVATVVCRPLSIRDAGPGGVNAQYRCPRCLYSWRTSWMREFTPREIR